MEFIRSTRLVIAYGIVVGRLLATLIAVPVLSCTQFGLHVAGSHFATDANVKQAVSSWLQTLISCTMQH